MSPFRILLLTGVAACTLAPRAHAQDDPRLKAIEAQIRALQAELSHVRRDLAASRAENRVASRQARPAAPDRNGAPPTATASAQQPGQAQSQAQGQAQGGQAGGGGGPVVVSSVAPPSTSAVDKPLDPGGVSFPKGRPTFTSNDGRFSAAVGLQLHYDLGGEFTGPSRNAQPQRLDSFG